MKLLSHKTLSFLGKIMPGKCPGKFRGGPITGHSDSTWYISVVDSLVRINNLLQHLKKEDTTIIKDSCFETGCGSTCIVTCLCRNVVADTTIIYPYLRMRSYCDTCIQTNWRLDCLHSTFNLFEYQPGSYGTGQFGGSDYDYYFNKYSGIIGYTIVLTKNIGLVIGDKFNSGMTHLTYHMHLIRYNGVETDLFKYFENMP